MGKSRGNIDILPSAAAGDELAAYKELEELYQDNPIPLDEQLANLGLFLTRAAMGRILFMHEMYQKIINTHGVIMDFGTRWGQNMALFSTFRSLYEPYNQSRKVIGFDTFKGFPSTSKEDGDIQEGSYSVTEGYEVYLADVMAAHSRLAPRGHIRKYEIIRGDVCETLPEYLKAHPETIVALAYFDMDLYKPTRECLELLKPYMLRGTVVGFDELGLAEFPGETEAFHGPTMVSWGPVQRSPISSYSSYVVVE